MYFDCAPQENLVESKHHKLVRSVRSGTVSHEMKPNAAVRDQLNVSIYIVLFLWILYVELNDEFCEGFHEKRLKLSSISMTPKWALDVRVYFILPRLKCLRTLSIFTRENRVNVMYKFIYTKVEFILLRKLA